MLDLMLYHHLDSSSITTKHSVNAPNAPSAKSNKNASKAVFFTSELAVSVIFGTGFRSTGLRAVTKASGNLRKVGSGIFAVAMSVEA